jgi:arylsulfatase A-like enzyme
MAVSYVDGQSPDVVVVYEPFTILWDTNYGTSHGSAWNYDAHVVLIFAGAGVRPGRYSGPVAMTDVAPTLAVLLGIAPPASAVGHPVGAVLALDGS